MVYKYCENQNFEELASGRVIVHRAGCPNFPVRLAQEIFGRCLYHLGNPDKVCIYDPCCGGYLLTVLGFLNFEKIKTAMASDISDDAIQLTSDQFIGSVITGNKGKNGGCDMFRQVAEVSVRSFPKSRKTGNRETRISDIQGGVESDYLYIDHML